MVNQPLLKVKISHVCRSVDKLKKHREMALDTLKSDSDLQDIVLHNLQMAIQGVIDISSHIVSDEAWGAPATLAGLYDILREHRVIDEKTAASMKRMAGFRNIIVHEYEDIDIVKVHQVLKENLGDFDAFLRQAAAFAKI